MCWMSKARDKFNIDLATYSQYDESFAKTKFDGKVPSDLVKAAKDIINRCSISQFEAYIVMICYRNEAPNKKKALAKAETQFAESGLIPHNWVFHKLWDRVLAIKNSSD